MRDAPPAEGGRLLPKTQRHPERAPPSAGRVEGTGQRKTSGNEAGSDARKFKTPNSRLMTHDWPQNLHKKKISHKNPIVLNTTCGCCFRNSTAMERRSAAAKKMRNAE